MDTRCRPDQAVYASAVLLLCLAVLPAAWAQQAVPELTGRVVDRADILSSSAEHTLTTLLAAYEDSTTHQVAILTVSSLGTEAIESYAIRVAEAWALGTEERDNGVLIVVAPSERKVRVEVGYGLEGALTDVQTGRIIQNQMIPAFEDGNYHAGVISGTMAVLETAASASIPTDPTAETADARPQYGLAFMAFLVLILTPLVLAVFLALLDNFLRPVLLVVLACFVFFGGCGVQVGMMGLDSSMGSRVFAGLLAAGLFAALFYYLRRRITGDEGFRDRWKEFVFGAALGGVFRSGRPGLNLKSSGGDGRGAPDTSHLFGTSLPARAAQKFLEALIFFYSIIIGFVLLANPITAIPLVIAYFVFRSKQSSKQETLEETSTQRARPSGVGGAAAGW